MNVIIHDLERDFFHSIFSFESEDVQIISDEGSIKNCIGCFGCWIKTPGECVLKDGYENMGRILSQADNVIVISRCCYGGYSPFVKNVFDRSISYLLPFFKIKRNETHHKQRYQNTFRFSVYFYGEHILEQEMKTARDLIKANSINFHVQEHEILFFSSLSELCNEVKAQWK